MDVRINAGQQARAVDQIRQAPCVIQGQGKRDGHPTPDRLHVGLWLHMAGAGSREKLIPPIKGVESRGTEYSHRTARLRDYVTFSRCMSASMLAFCPPLRNTRPLYSFSVAGGDCHASLGKRSIS